MIEYRNSILYKKFVSFFGGSEYRDPIWDGRPNQSYLTHRALQTEEGKQRLLKKIKKAKEEYSLSKKNLNERI